MTEECNWLDTKNKSGTCKPRGFNIEPAEKFLISKGGYAKPIGEAIKKEYGKRLSSGEWTRQHGQPATAMDIVWQAGLELGRINKRISKQAKQEVSKHLK